MSSLHREEYSYAIVAQGPGQQFMDTKLRGRSFLVVLQWLITLANTVQGFETEFSAVKRLWVAFFGTLFESDDDDLYECMTFFRSLIAIKTQYQKLQSLVKTNADDYFSYKFYPSPSFVDVRDDFCRATKLASCYLWSLEPTHGLNYADRKKHIKMFLIECFGLRRLDDENMSEGSATFMNILANAATTCNSMLHVLGTKSLVYYHYHYHYHYWPRTCNGRELLYSWLIQMKNTLVTTEASGVVTNWASVFGAHQGKVLSCSGNLFLHNLKLFEDCLLELHHMPIGPGRFTTPMESTGGVLFDLHSALAALEQFLDPVTDETSQESLVGLVLDEFDTVYVDDFRQLNYAKTRILLLKQTIPPLLADVRYLLGSLTTPPLGYKALLDWMIMLKNAVEDCKVDEQQRKSSWCDFLQTSYTDETAHFFFGFFDHIYQLHKLVLICMNSDDALPTTVKFPAGVEYERAKVNICKAAMALGYYCKKFRGIDPRDIVEFIKAEYGVPFCRNDLLLLDVLENYPAKTWDLAQGIVQHTTRGQINGEMERDVIGYYLQAQNRANALMGFKSTNLDTRPHQEIIKEFFEPPEEPIENMMQWMLKLCNTVQCGEYQCEMQNERWVDFFPAHMSSTAMVPAANSCTCTTKCLRRLAHLLNIHGGILNISSTFAICPSFLVIKHTLFDVLTRMHLFLTELECCNEDYYAEFLAKNYYLNAEAIRGISSFTLGSSTITLAHEAAYHLGEMIDYLYPRNKHINRDTRKSKRRIMLVSLTSLGGLAMLIFSLWVLRERSL